MRGPEKDRKLDPTGSIWTGLRLRLPPLFGWMNRLNRLQLPQDTPSKYLQNAPKNIENDQDLNMLLNFTDGYEIHLVNTFKTHLQTLKTIKI